MHLLLTVFLLVVSVFMTPKPAGATDDYPLRIQETENERDRVQEAKEEALKNREEAMEKLREHKEEALENAETRREEFRLKLQEIRDERKQKILENLVERFENVNTGWTNHWNNVLTRLTEILSKVTTRADTLEGAGKDVSSVRTAVAAATAAIDAAQTAIDEQAGNSYTIEIDTEANLGQMTNEAIGVLHEDLRKVGGLIEEARTLVLAAIRALGEIGDLNAE